MRKLYLLPAVISGLAYVALFVAARENHPSPRRTMNINCYKGFDQIHSGMRQEEVEAILGGPPGDYSDGIQDVRIVGQPEERLGVVTKEWRSNEGILMVGFDEQGAVAGIEFSSGFLPGKRSFANGAAILPPRDAESDRWAAAWFAFRCAFRPMLF
jgi:hypothetical protein